MQLETLSIKWQSARCRISRDSDVRGGITSHRRESRRSLLHIWMGVFLCAAIGCSGQESAHVEGTITLKDGKPLVGATITAREKSNGRAVYGYTDGDGHFELKSEGSGSGIPIGEYEVIVVEERGSLDSQRPPTIASKYQNASMSGLELSLKSGEDQNVSWTLDGP
jgi:hypothetical protein